MEVICSPKRRFNLKLHGTKSQKGSITHEDVLRNKGKVPLIHSLGNNSQNEYEGMGLSSRAEKGPHLPTDGPKALSVQGRFEETRMPVPGTEHKPFCTSESSARCPSLKRLPAVGVTNTRVRQCLRLYRAHDHYNMNPVLNALQLSKYRSPVVC
jgi:hypothetical protein